MDSSSLILDVGRYKSEIITHLLDSNEIMEVLLDKKDFTVNEVDSIVYKQIFPTLYVDETQSEQLSYICIEVDIPTVPTANIKDMKLIIWIYTHRGVMKYTKAGFYGTRADILADMVERELRDITEFGIGKLHLESATYLNPSTSFYGRQLIFSVPDFKIKKK